MTRPVRGLLVPVIALVIVLGTVPRAAEASLIGDSVTCTVSLANFGCTPSPATVGAGPEFTVATSFSSFFSIDLDASSITMTALSDFKAGDLLNLVFGDLDSSLGDIVGASVVASGVEGTIDNNDLSFTAHSVAINVGTTVPPVTVWTLGDTAVISLTFAPAAVVPAPATLLLVGAGIVGVGAWRRRIAP